MDVSVGWPAGRNGVSEMEVPEEGHIILGRGADVISYAAVHKFLMKDSQHRQLILGSELSAFSQKIPVFVQSNTFYPLFSRKMYQICSSGLHNYWEKTNLAPLIYKSVVFTEYRISMNSDGEKITSKQVEYRRAARHGDFNPFQKEGESALPLSFGYMKTPLDVTGLCFVFSFAVFTAEILKTHVQNKVSTLHFNQKRATSCFKGLSH